MVCVFLSSLWAVASSKITADICNSGFILSLWSSSPRGQHHGAESACTLLRSRWNWNTGPTISIMGVTFILSNFCNIRYYLPLPGWATGWGSVYCLPPSTYDVHLSFPGKLTPKEVMRFCAEPCELGPRALSLLEPWVLSEAAPQRKANRDPQLTWPVSS